MRSWKILFVYFQQICENFFFKYYDNTSINRNNGFRSGKQFLHIIINRCNTVIYLESWPRVFFYPRGLSLVAPVLGKTAVPQAPTQVLNVAYSVCQDLHLGNPELRVLSTGRDFPSEFLECFVDCPYSGPLSSVPFFHILRRPLSVRNMLAFSFGSFPEICRIIFVFYCTHIRCYSIKIHFNIHKVEWISEFSIAVQTYVRNKIQTLDIYAFLDKFY